MFINALAVGCGGFIGAVMRYLLSVAFPYKGGFPWTTFSVNMLGTFLLAFLVEIFAHKVGVSESTSLLLRVGLCGGFTTFSTFSVETLLLVEQGQWSTALIYVLASCLVGLVFAVVGTYAGQLV
ncbi:fluoride efflux transporter CrcB [Gleimia sp. 6138-11-ORH1]|uniref:fluoride efflux transporter CrcB n=1 Tax=Gleimia sp. 6138-11-ORH1 TaxID=2973937 RepID=UPI00216A8672|nr:fluoride efflux transporter CrcB [Gleimia sp. 6138-11-ORH1]MCS4484154.1 fluoride efflux transporter CrcB [Gleimia sp. 6138-11-ORH1]